MATSTAAASASSPTASRAPAPPPRSPRCTRSATAGRHMSASDGAGVGSEHDQEAAERFHADGVDTILPFVSGSSLVQMLARLRHRLPASHPRPRDRRARHRRHRQPHAAAIYDGTQALVMNRDRRDPRRATTRPARRADRRRLRALRRPHERSGRATSGELSNVLIVADLAAPVRRDPQRPRDVTRESLVDGLERIEDADRQRWPHHVPTGRALGVSRDAGDPMVGSRGTWACVSDVASSTTCARRPSRSSTLK